MTRRGAGVDEHRVVHVLVKALGGSKPHGAEVDGSSEGDGGNENLNGEELPFPQKKTLHLYGILVTKASSSSRNKAVKKLMRNWSAKCEAR
jgi:hypothetical protein